LRARSILSVLAAAAALAPLARADAPATPTTAPSAYDRADARVAVAERWAPTIYQETRDRRDLISAFDFDGDWDLTNNAAHVATAPLRAVVYYTVAETASHWIVTYLPYHPVDAKRVSGHDNDTEHITIVVRKDGSPTGRLEVLETRFHYTFYQYVAPGAAVRDGADDIDGPIHFDGDHPAVQQQRVGHGICGGFTPIALIDDFAFECDHRTEPHIARRGVVYRFRGRADEPRSLDDRDVGYALQEIGETLWPRAHPGGRVFSSALDFHGARCARFHCPTRVGALLAAAAGHGTTGPPWQESPGRGVRAVGEAFFDPAYTLSRRLRFAAPFSVDYVWNP
jgi:hypothetical protein